jgi:hypothetical protein
LAAFASRYDIALIGCHFADKPHGELVESYANAAQDSGQALLDAIVAFSSRSGHPELANAPLLLWGMSAGGEFNYEFTAWDLSAWLRSLQTKVAFIFLLFCRRLRAGSPGLLFVGEEDLEWRRRVVVGLFAAVLRQHRRNLAFFGGKNLGVIGPSKAEAVRSAQRPFSARGRGGRTLAYRPTSMSVVASVHRTLWRRS